MKKIKIKKSPGSKPELPKGGYGFVVGNGTSRAGVDLKPLMDYGVLYACNWFFKEEFKPHVLVCSDEPITRTVNKDFPNYSRRNWMYSWFPKPGSGVKKATCPEKFAAGPMATELACGRHEKEKVFLIGIDFFGFGSKNKMNNGKLNNLYAGKKHYVKGEKAVAPTYRNWQRRFEWILRNYPDTEIYQVNPFEGKSPERLRGFPNFHQITMENLMDHLENDAELVDLLEKTPEDVEILRNINEDDVRAILERQFAGQENVIYKDILTDEQVLQYRQAATDAARKQMTTFDNQGMVHMKILGLEVTVQVFSVKEGSIVRVANPDEVIMLHRKIQAERSRIIESWRSKGFKGIKVKIEGAPVAPPALLAGLGGAPLPPPPPPPSVGGLNLPPPPPPMTNFE